MVAWTFCNGNGNARWRSKCKRFLRCHSRWAVHAYACPARGFERGLLLPSETLTRVLEGLNCKVWMDDVIYWVLDETDLLHTLDLIGALGRCRPVR